MLAGAACRLVYLWLAPQRVPIESDDKFYWTTAKSLAHGLGYTVDGRAATEWMPGFPLFLAPWVRLFDDNMTACRVVGVLLSVATIPILGCATTRWFNERIARGTTWALALYSPFWFYSTAFASETLAIFWVVS